MGTVAGYVVYTCITHDYDTLKEPCVISDGWKYVCFSDREIQSDVWDVRPADRSDRDYKINCPFKGVSLWVDGSIEIVGNLNGFIKEVPLWFSLWKHPHRVCTYDEANAVVKLKGCDELEVHNQVMRYMEDGFPRGYGLGANGIMLRDMSDKTVKKICREWWIEYTNGVPRDQISLMYTCWRNGVRPVLFDNHMMNKYFAWRRHK